MNLERELTKLKEDVKRYVVTLTITVALIVAGDWHRESRINALEKQVDTLGKAVKAAHGEAKEAQRTQRNPYYLPDPLKVVKK